MLVEVPFSYKLWLKIVENSPDATFFHTPYWFELLKGIKRVTPCYPLIFRYKNCYILFPFGKTRILKGLWSVYESVPVGVYGGPIADGDIKKEMYAKIMNRIEHIFKGNILITLPPSKEIDEKNVFSNSNTYIKALELVREKGWSGVSKGHKYAIRKARKNLYVREANPEEMKDYEKLYISFVKKKRRKRRYTHLFFERIKEIMPKKVVRLWVVLHKEKIIGGLVVAYFKDKAYCIHIASNVEYGDFYPHHLLCWETIIHAAKNGYRFYDFLPSGAYATVDIFKKGFGTTPYPVRSYKGTHPLLNTALRIQRVNIG